MADQLSDRGHLASGLDGGPINSLERLTAVAVVRGSLLNIDVSRLQPASPQHY
jgi:hypothetical protein